MRANFAFEHLRRDAAIGDSMHFHAYALKRTADSSYRLSLCERLSTDADGVAIGLGLHTDARIEMSEVEENLLRKIGPTTLFTPV